MKKYLLFDLDGTLSDPKVGICTCVQYALKDFGIDEPDLDKLEPFIGPPLKDSFMDFYGFDEDKAAAAVAKYRERYKDTGLFENEIYPGIAEMLRELNAKGMYLAVASSKPTVFVERILEHFNIRKYFKVVVGSELDGTRSSKDEVVQEALRQLFGDKPVDKDKVYMIGDRKFDVEGARAFGIESVGVTYGYGSMEELREAKADYIVRSVEELKKFLLRGTNDIPKGLTMKRVIQFGFPFLSFLIVRRLIVSLMVMIFANMNGTLAGIPMLTYDEAGMANGFTGTGYALSQILAFVAGTFMIRKFAVFMIKKEAEDSFLLHIKGEPRLHYVLFGVVTLTGMFGLNFLLSLSGLIASSEGFQEVAEAQKTPPLILGILLYAVVAPIAEEMLFRGIIYNCLKRCINKLPAVILAAAFFAMYHGNSVQGVYGFLMACLFIYAYEFFGDFKVPVAMHAGINLITFLLSYVSLEKTGIMNWPVCLILLAVCSGALYVLTRKKKVF